MAEASFGKVAWNAQVVVRRFPHPVPVLSDDRDFLVCKAVTGA